ncbi:MAG: calcium-translocating P-type ATPase, PMCA-type, partial [Bacteroidales bacterium]|nr:calcium-translocating P-type ATPase, PMCA-type [Bacteroidales bacterium]
YYYNQSVEEVANDLNTSITQGLTKNEAATRLEKSGYNEFAKKKSKSIWVKFLEQFKSFMIIVLLIAAVISGVTGYLHGEGFTDAIIILVIVFVNAIIGLVQEEKAEKSLEALEKMSAPQCKVIRDGKVLTIESRNLVPGDVVLLDTGDAIPADLRLTEAVNLKVQEAALTGESVPSEKETAVIQRENVPLGDRDNIGFSSTNVVYGRGKGIVIRTGMDTEVGKIASMIQSVPNHQTPLQQKLDKLGKHLGIAALIICAIIFAVGVFYGNDLLSMFMVAVSLAVAAIPEGLPAVSTIVLAVGVQRLAKKHAIVRTLPSVETLGSTNVICSDKTGTLTQNKMTVTKVFTDDTVADVNEMNSSSSVSEDSRQLIEIAVLANDAKLTEEGTNYTTTGDPTETALVDLGLKFDFNKNAQEKVFKRIAEIPFDSERKLMTTVHDKGDSQLHVYTKGGLDELLNCCTSVQINGKVVPITEEQVKFIKNENVKLAENALRVLAMAYKRIDNLPHKVTSETLEKDLIFVGMLGMIDPPRPEVKDAVLKCRDAGIRPVMITGDHLITAKAIAKELNILQEKDLAITGADLEKMSDEELKEKVNQISVYARTSPENKMRIVKALQAKGAIVAMTGDGVNDAPALKLADIGVAMGITGTDVSKEAADIVLTDDNFSTIVSSVEEGRRIYDNIIKAVEFLLSCNIGEIVVLFVAVVANWATPLLPIHILWINLVTDSLPALALSVDPANADVMKRKPIDSKKPILNKRFSILLLFQGIMIGSLALIAFQIGLNTTLVQEDAIEVARAMCFSVLAFSQLIHVFNIRSNVRSAFSNFLSNKYLLGAIAISVGLMLMVLEIPFLHDLFHINDLSNMQWMWVAILSIAPIPIIEFIKWIERLINKDNSIFAR